MVTLKGFNLSLIETEFVTSNKDRRKCLFEEYDEVVDRKRQLVLFLLDAYLILSSYDPLLTMV